MSDSSKVDESKEAGAKTEVNQESQDENKPDKIAKITKTVLTICVVIFIWQLLADRFTPYTDQARVQALVVPIVPKVSGYVKGVYQALGGLGSGTRFGINQYRK